VEVSWTEASWTRFRGQTGLTLSETLVDETSVKVVAPSVHETPSGGTRLCSCYSCRTRAGTEAGDLCGGTAKDPGATSPFVSRAARGRSA
jgi:hypothetical protein